VCTLSSVQTCEVSCGYNSELPSNVYIANVPGVVNVVTTFILQGWCQTLGTNNVYTSVRSYFKHDQRLAEIAQNNQRKHASCCEHLSNIHLLSDTNPYSCNNTNYKKKTLLFF